MVKRVTLAVGAILALFAGAAIDVGAQPQPQGKCLVGKNKCVSKKAGSLLKCEQKAETPDKPLDPNQGGCVDKARAKFDGGAEPEKGCFEKLESKTPNDCITFTDTNSMELLIDSCVAKIVDGIDPAPIDQTKCGVGKKKCAAKKLKSVLKCYQKAQTLGKSNDPNFGDCITKAKAKFDGGAAPEKGCFEKLENKANNDCVAPFDNTMVVEGIIDNSCVGAFIAALDTPTTTTTTTTVSTTTTTSTSTTTTTAPTTTTTTTTAPTTTTTTTTAPTTTTTTTSSTTTTTGPGFTRLAFTTAVGTTNCGGRKLSPAPTAPFSGAVYSDVACTTKLSDLGLGCLNIGGGSANVQPAPIPDAARGIFGLSGANLVATTATARVNCTKGAGPGKHCIGSGNNGMACTVDTDCLTALGTGACAPDANCFFAPPLPIPSTAPGLAALTTCVVNVIKTDASGTINLGTGDVTTNIPLSSRVYLTGNLASPCPKCVGGLCNAGPRAGLSCTPVRTLQTTLDCPPTPAQLQGAIDVTLNPLRTGAASLTDAAGNFCPSQAHAGAHGLPLAKDPKSVG